MHTSKSELVAFRAPPTLIADLDQLLDQRRAAQPHAVLTRADILREALATFLRTAHR